MTLKTDLEQHIRGSYKLIQEFEDILQFSDNPKEKARSRRAIGEQWELIKRYLSDYTSICERSNLPIPEDIALIMVLFQRTDSLGNPSTVPGEQNVHSDWFLLQDALSGSSTSLTESKKLARVQQEHMPSSLSELIDVPKHYLWGHFTLLVLFLIGAIEGLVGIFDVPTCTRRLALATLTSLGGLAILGLSFLTRYRDSYQRWDRWLTLGLLIAAACVLSWLTYQKCIPIEAP
jgi:hypothetical protein